VGAALTRRQAMAALGGVCPIALAAGETSRWQAASEYLKSAAPGAAAEYVAAQIAEAGLRPAGESGLFPQPVPFFSKRLDSDASSLALRSGAGIIAMRLGDDAAIDVRVDPASAFDAELAFVGYGLRIPEIHHDDFDGVQTKDRVAVYLDGAPADARGEMGDYYRTPPVRWRAMKAAGIVGMVGIGGAQASGGAMQLTDPAMNELAGSRIWVRWNPARAEPLFAGTGHTFRELSEVAAAGRTLPRFAIDARLQAKTVVKRAEARAANVAGIYPGGSKEKELVVVVSAISDAAGVASSIESARRLSEERTKVARSVLFLAAAGDEDGQAGVAYFLARSSVLKSAVGVIGVAATGEWPGSAAWGLISRGVPGVEIEGGRGDMSAEIVRSVTGAADGKRRPQWPADSWFRRFSR
jgi:hypothetical protein